MTVTIDLSKEKNDFTTRAALYDLSRAVVKSKKVVVVTGAGISCSSGIPVGFPKSALSPQLTIIARTFGLQMAFITL